ncbi:MAG: 5-formyltetrahydrofolate cyclo-ligase [Candidatus Omnitrophica bacterium]|nr:5-formyltetrahydrofolate cyclo-ligase [Candidatus Omnitrophota bacterium]
MKDKSSLRKYYLELLKKQASKDRRNKSRLIEAKLFELDAVQRAKTILFYASLPGEVDTFAMIVKAIQLKKRICLPMVVRHQRKMIPTLTKKVTDLENGVYGIAQPRYDASKAVALEDIDAVIVPGLAFDRSNNRLGRGAGYYDRFLKNLPPDIPTIGLAFDFQLTDRLPVQQHDVAVSVVVAN